ncbi:hypothetical protein Trydic_g14989 [Trypoxylus dichotomus]
MTELGIKVDFVKQGYGFTNIGNIPKILFRNPPSTADITQINEKLIRRLGVILEVINSNTTVNEILTHGADIITAAALLIGLLSEKLQIL